MASQWHTQWAISVKADPPGVGNVFDSREEAESGLWPEGGERLMTRQVTDWEPA